MENKIFYKIKFLLFISIFLSGNLILQSQSKLTKTAPERKNNFYGNTNFSRNYHNISSLNSRQFFTKQKLKTYSNIRKGVNSRLFESVSTINSFSHSFNKHNYNSSTVVDSVVGKGILGIKFKEKYEFDNNGNLISEVEQTLNGSQWINSLRTTYTYNQNRMRTLILHENWSGSQWVGVDRNTFTYDSNGNRIEELSENWAGTDWINNNRYTTSYDSDGNPISILTEKWDLIQSQWLNDSRNLASQEPGGSIIKIQENWDGSKWVKDIRSTTGFDSNNRQAFQLAENWDGSNWVKHDRSSFTYDSNGRLNSLLGEEWNGSNWQNSWQYTYVVNTNGSRTSRLFENWNTLSNSWEGVSRITYMYDSNGNNTEKLEEDWDGSQWVNMTRVTLSYDSDNNMIFALAEDWESSTWIESPSFIGFNTGSFTNNNYRSYFFFASQITVYYNSITAVESDDILPAHFKLSQNYPNPFNPSTTIKYSIAQNSFVSLKVYNILGKEAATLVNKEQSSGNHEVNFSGSQLASGIYYYSLKAGNNTITKKMILMK